MPIVSIVAQHHADSTPIENIVKDVQEVGAKALGCEKSNVWVHFQPAEAGYYLQSPDAHPDPFVLIRANAGRSLEVRERFVKAIADAVARGTGVPSERVWIHYQEMNHRDIWYGGSWAS